MFLSRGDRDPGVAFQTDPGSQASSTGKTKDSALLSNCDGYLLGTTEWPNGIQASCGVWRVDSGLLSSPCRKRRPSSHDFRGVLWVVSSCGASVGFLTRYDKKLREPLVWHQGSQVSMRLERGSVSLLSSHGRGIGPQDALKNKSRGLSRVAAGILGFPRLVSVTSGNFSGCL